MTLMSLHAIALLRGPMVRRSTGYTKPTFVVGKQHYCKPGSLSATVHDKPRVALGPSTRLLQLIVDPGQRSQRRGPPDRGDRQQGHLLHLFARYPDGPTAPDMRSNCPFEPAADADGQFQEPLAFYVKSTDQSGRLPQTVVRFPDRRILARNLLNDGRKAVLCHGDAPVSEKGKQNCPRERMCSLVGIVVAISATTSNPSCVADVSRASIAVNRLSPNPRCRPIAES